MRYQDITKILKRAGLPVTYFSFPEDDLQHPVPPLPYIIFYIPRTRAEAADNTTASRIAQINIELYTKEKDFDLEELLERILDAECLICEKEEVFLKSENMYEVLYITEAVIDSEENINEN